MLTLVYFNAMARGLGPALALERGGAEWQRDPVPDREDLKANRRKYPFGQLPVLRDEASGAVVAQTIAIGCYIGRKTGTAGATEQEQILNDILLCEFETLYGFLNETFPTPYEKTDVTLFVKSRDHAIPAQFDYLEELLASRGRDGSFTTGAASAGESMLFSVIHQIVLCLPSCLDQFPGLALWYERILAEPKVQKVLEGESPYGKFTQYFIHPAEEDLAAVA